MKLTPIIAALATATACALVGGASPAAAQASPTELGNDPRFLNLQNAFQRFEPGAPCSVPTTDGDVIRLNVVAETDTSKRIGEVRYLAYVPFSGAAPLELGRGKVMVLAAEGVQGFGPVSVERPGPPAAKRYTCSWSNWGGIMALEIVHLSPVQKPSLEALTAWCVDFSWITSCPTHLAAKG